MIRIPGKIPVTITGGFWIVAALIGFLNTFSIIGTLVWMVIILVSVLFHEFGHALTALAFGQHPRIELVPFGGATYPEGPKLKLWKEFIVVFSGPLFGFFLFLLGTFLLPFIDQARLPLLFASVRTFQIVNIFWTIINLLPIIPMDGGQLLRIILEAFLGFKAIRVALLIGIIVAAGFSLAFFLYGFFLIGAIFFLFAFQNFENWRRSRTLSSSDQNEKYKQLFQIAETAFLQGQKDKARQGFLDLKEKTKKGILFNIACQRLAQFKAQEGDFKAVYELLKPIEAEVSEELFPIFQQASHEAQDFSLTEKLGNVCYRTQPSQEIALRNADACAAQGKTDATIGWLRAALESGELNLKGVVERPIYDKVRQDPEFQEFLNEKPL